MSKNNKNKIRINSILDKIYRKFPEANPAMIRKIWLDGYSEGKQARETLNKQLL